jgi:hypothetical protein
LAIVDIFLEHVQSLPIALSHQERDIKITAVRSANPLNCFRVSASHTGTARKYDNFPAGR